MLQQKAAKLIDRGGSPADPTIKHAMQGLKIQLRLVLDRNKPHGRPLHCFRNGFRVEIVALFRLDERSDILSWHNLDVVPLCQKSTG